MLIDGVFSGGGIKAFSLIGAIEEAEKRNLEFVRVAGTSAGSIVAAFIAAGYTSKQIYKILDGLDLRMLIDPKKNSIPFSLLRWLLIYWKMGLYNGKALEDWIAEKLAAKGLVTFADMPEHSLRVIASDLTNGQMIILPDDLRKYGISPGSFPIAKAIRMSCSLPYFFEPVRLKYSTGTNLIVDGGVLSNFPMWLFDQERKKKIRPVLGIKLTSRTQELPKHNVKNAISMFEALFETMKTAHDARYISRKHEKNIIFIPTEGVSGMDFNLSDAQKQALILIGKQSAKKFFQSWSC